MQPSSNPNVSRSQRQVFYNFTRRYGEQIQLSKLNSTSVDYTTGELSRDYETKTIRNAVYVPPTAQNKVLYTPAMMQAMRQFAWQGGAGQNVEETMFLIFINDIRGWGKIDSTQRVSWRSQTYEVVSSQEFDGGIIISAKVARVGPQPQSFGANNAVDTDQLVAVDVVEVVSPTFDSDSVTFDSSELTFDGEV